MQPVATVLPMPKIEEDFTSEQPDYDDKDEEELEGSDLDDMCLVDLCSSDDDDVSELVPVDFYPVTAIAKHACYSLFISYIPKHVCTLDEVDCLQQTILAWLATLSQ